MSEELLTVVTTFIVGLMGLGGLIWIFVGADDNYRLPDKWMFIACFGLFPIIGLTALTSCTIVGFFISMIVYTFTGWRFVVDKRRTSRRQW